MTKEMRAKMEAEARAIQINNIINNGMTVERAEELIKSNQAVIAQWESKGALDPSSKVAYAKGQIKHWEEVIEAINATVKAVA